MQLKTIGVFLSLALSSAGVLAGEGQAHIWPDMAESQRFQIFPVYPDTVTCFRQQANRIASPRTEKEKVCAGVNKALRGTFYHAATVALPGSDNSIQVKQREEYAFTDSAGAGFANANVVVMPAYADSVTCWKSDVEGGSNECRALRPALRNVAFKYVVIPNASARAAIARADK